MADEINEVQVEKLTLQIDVKGATASQTKKINAFADSLKNLDKALSESLLNRIEKLNKLNLGFGKVTGLSKMAKSMAKNQKAMEKSLLFPSISNNIESKTSQENNLPSTNLNQPKNENVIDAEYTEKTIKKYTNLGATLKDLKKVSGALQKTFGRLTKTLKKGARMIGIVIAYSLAFKALQVITQGVSEGISNLAVFDKQANKTMSELTTATQNLKNAVGMIAMPIVELITPAVQKISIALVNIANKISEIRASAKGLATYTKISSKYMNDYAKSIQGTSFSFDTFTALQSSVFDMYDMEEISLSTEEANREMNKFKLTLVAVGSLIGGIFVASRISTFVQVLSGVALSFSTISGIVLLIFGAITSISAGIDMIINGFSWESFIAMVAGLGAIVGGIALVFGGVPALIAGIVAGVIALVAVIVGNWDWIVANILTPIGNFFVTIGTAIGTFFSQTLPNFFVEAWNTIKATFISIADWIYSNVVKPVGNFFISMINGIISGFETMINGLLTGVNKLLTGVEDIVAFFGGELDIKDLSVSFTRIPMLANGGMVNAGSLFIAGESGAELLTNMGSGTTGVTNVSQFKQAMIEAIYETGLLSSIEESGNIYLDSEKVGRKMGQTKSLRQQLNRTNPNLNLK